jgi:hypothetical protein
LGLTAGRGEPPPDLGFTAGREEPPPVFGLTAGLVLPDPPVFGLTVGRALPLVPVFTVGLEGWAAGLPAPPLPDVLTLEGTLPEVPEEEVVGRPAELPVAGAEPFPPVRTLADGLLGTPWDPEPPVRAVGTVGRLSNTGLELRPFPGDSVWARPEGRPAAPPGITPGRFGILDPAPLEPAEGRRSADPAAAPPAPGVVVARPWAVGASPGAVPRGGTEALPLPAELRRTTSGVVGSPSARSLKENRGL